MVELVGVAGGDDEKMLAGGDAIGAVVDEALVAVEGEAVVHVALDALDGEGFEAGGLAVDLACQGAGGVVDIEVFAVEAEEEDQGREDGDKGGVADLRDSPAADDEKDHGADGYGRCGGGDEPLGGGEEGLVLHVLGREHEDEDEDGADGGVGPDEPLGQAAAAQAIEVVGREDGEGRNGGKDVSGEFGTGEGEEEDGEEGPEDEELGEGVAGAGVAEVTLGIVADLPLGDGDLDGVDEGADGDDGPRHESEQKNAEVVPEGLVMLVAVGGEALEIVLEEEKLVEGGIASLDGDVPGEDHYEVKNDAGEPDGAAEERPLAAETGEEKDDDEGKEGGNGAFGEGGCGSEEVEVEEPELFAGLVPGVPTEHADTEGSG